MEQDSLRHFALTGKYIPKKTEESLASRINVLVNVLAFLIQTRHNEAKMLIILTHCSGLPSCFKPVNFSLVSTKNNAIPLSIVPHNVDDALELSVITGEDVGIVCNRDAGHTDWANPEPKVGVICSY